jgi:hypothetical protein
MDPFPFSALLVVQGARYSMTELSEAGVTLPAAVLDAEPFCDLAPSSGFEASVVLYEGDLVDTYPVRLRLAGQHHRVAEFVFTELPPVLRLRLRPVEVEESDALSGAAQSGQRSGPAERRRLVLPGSASVLAITDMRRRAWLQGQSLNLMVATTAADLGALVREQRGRFLVASGVLLAGLTLLAWLAFG